MVMAENTRISVLRRVATKRMPGIDPSPAVLLRIYFEITQIPLDRHDDVLLSLFSRELTRCDRGVIDGLSRTSTVRDLIEQLFVRSHPLALLRTGLMLAPLRALNDGVKQS